MALLLALPICGIYGAIHLRRELIAIYALYEPLVVAQRVYWIYISSNLLKSPIAGHNSPSGFFADQGPFSTVDNGLDVLGIIIAFYIFVSTVRLVMMIQSLTAAEKQSIETFQQASNDNY
jgi:hypothetical protein